MNVNSTIDSNILIYAFGMQNDSKKSIAKEILADCNKISLQALNETIFVLHRKFNFALDELNKIIQFFKENFDIKGIDVETLKKAMLIMEKYNYSFWDSMMLAAAIENQCKEIYSEDMQNNQIIEGTLKIINPFLMIV